MTAQRTTLLTMCLVQLALIFNGEGVDKIKLLATDIEVSYQYAITTIGVIIFLNSVSYVWRWFAEPQLGHEKTIVDRLDNLRQQSESVLGRIKDLGGPHTITERLKEAAKDTGPEFRNDLMDIVGGAINHAKHSIRYHQECENLLKRKINAGHWRDIIFDVSLVGLIALSAIVLSFAAPINLNAQPAQLTQPTTNDPASTPD